MRAAALGCFLAAACSNPPQKIAAVEMTATVTVSAAPPSEIAPVASAKVRTTTEIALAPPTDAVCELTAAQWTKAPAFRLKLDGPAFGSVQRLENARVYIRRDPSKSGLVLRGETGPVELIGLGVVDELSVLPQRNLLLGGVFVPFGSTALRLLNADVGVVRVGLSQPPIELTSLTVQLDTESVCTAIGLAWGKADPKDFVGKGIDGGVLAGETIPLATSEGGEPVTTLVPTTGGRRDVDVLEKGKTATRIAWPLRAGYVTGWVPKAAVKPAKRLPGQGYGTGSGTLANRRKTPRESRSCEREIALGAAIDNTSAFVGRIKPGAILDLYEDDGERVSVVVREAGIRVGEGARLFVEREAIKSCPIAPPPP